MKQKKIHKTTFIYALIDPRNNSVCYIGKADNPKRRFNKHLYDSAHLHKVYWIQSLLKQNLLPELLIIDEIDYIDWPFWEKHYLDLYKSFGFILLNAAEPGLGGDTYTNATKESKIKRIEKQKQSLKNSEKRKKIMSSIEYKQKMSIAQTGIKNGFFNKHHSLNMRKYLSLKAKNRQKYICSHCGKISDVSNYVRWHGYNCKFKIAA